MLLLLGCASALRPQAAQTDSTVLTGSCPSRAANAVNWDEVVTAPDVPARPTRESVVSPPPNMRKPSTEVLGRALMAIVIDATGRVVLGTVSVLESTEHELSAWMCMTVPTFRFEPARVAGKPGVNLFPQADSLGGAPSSPRKGSYVPDGCVRARAPLGRHLL